MGSTERLWSIGVATLATRGARFARLMDTLLPQCEADGRVEVIGLHNNGGRPLGVYRNALLGAATGEYVSFVDDDDLVEDDFVAQVTGAMTTYPWPDYIAFRHAYYENGVLQRPVLTGIDLGGWHDTAAAFLRDVTQVNPVRRVLTEGADFCAASDGAEDWSYISQVRPRIATQQLIQDAERAMYHYYYDPHDSHQRALAAGDPAPRPVIDSPCFRWIEAP